MEMPICYIVFIICENASRYKRTGANIALETEGRMPCYTKSIRVGILWSKEENLKCFRVNKSRLREALTLLVKTKSLKRHANSSLGNNPQGSKSLQSGIPLADAEGLASHMPPFGR